MCDGHASIFLSLAIENNSFVLFLRRKYKSRRIRPSCYYWLFSDCLINFTAISNFLGTRKCLIINHICSCSKFYGTCFACIFHVNHICKGQTVKHICLEWSILFSWFALVCLHFIDRIVHYLHREISTNFSHGSSSLDSFWLRMCHSALSLVW